MTKLNKKISKICFLFMGLVLLLCSLSTTTLAAGYEGYKAGTYTVDASLKCYVNAMGGIEFGNPLLQSASITVDGDGNCTMTLKFTKSSVTIYSITCDTFIDVNPSYVTEDRGVKSGTIGYYDENGKLQTDKVSYTLSNNTALNAANEQVQYVDSITFPLTYVSNEYNLSLFINSNVMGVQFCNNNNKATTTTYPATLSVKWDNTNVASGQEETPAIDNNEKDTDISNNNSSATIVEADGMNIHYADDTVVPTSTSDVANPSYTAYINTKALVTIGICACVFIGAGILILIISQKTKKGKQES